MNIPLQVNTDEEASGPAEACEYMYIPPAAPDMDNQVDGEMSGVQAGWVYGDITVDNSSSLLPSLPELVARRVAVEELEQVRHEFVEPARFDDAHRELAAHHIVVLCGTGTGRTFAGWRLLADQGITDIVDLNPDRRLGSISESDLLPGEGYLWDVSDQGRHPFTGWEFNRAAAFGRSVGCHLVIVLDNRQQAPPEVSRYITELRPPDPVEVAVAVLDHRYPQVREQAKQVLKCDLADALAESDPPEKAVRAALLAMEIVTGRCETTDALDALSEDAEHAVTAVLEGWSVIEYSMSLAVALLEDRSFDEVAAQAIKLDKMIRTAESLPDTPLLPRQIFAISRHKLLADIRAVTIKREHPRRPGLTEETVRFARQGWRDAVLRLVWREYHESRAVFRDWMCAPALLDRFSSAAVRALCTLITEVSAYELVDHLASRHSVKQRQLAARVLTRLAGAHGLRPLVEQTLESWVTSDSVYRQFTSALVYGSGFGVQDPHQALYQLTSLGCSSNVKVQNAVVGGILGLLSQPMNQENVLNTVVSWLSQSSLGSECLHTVALGVGMRVVGFSRDSSPETVDSVLLAKQYPEQVSILAKGILEDQRFGHAALMRLAKLACFVDLSRLRQREFFPTHESAELLRLVTNFAPDLRWWPRRRAVAALSRQYPARRTQIRRIFRTASKLQRAERSL
ncbi:MAG: hypothetical protein ACRDTG_31515 [Pseudonocardiaceae bacterium]